MRNGFLLQIRREFHVYTVDFVNFNILPDPAK